MHKKIQIVVCITILFLGTCITPSTGGISKTSFICKSNNPPYEPSDPIPPDGTENWTGGKLCWSGGDPDGDNVTYDVYLGTITPPPLIKENHTSTCYEPDIMNYSTKYYWQIVAWDEHGASTSGPIWNFTTSGKNHPPSTPEINVHKGVPLGTVNLTIKSTDPEGDDVFYFIEWGDGTFLYWIGPYESGENVTIPHSYPPITALYEGRAQAKDIFDAGSGLTNFYIFILRNRPTSYMRYQWFFERFPLLERLLDLIRVI